MAEWRLQSRRKSVVDEAFLTGSESMAVRAGADRVMQKPFKAVDLVGMMRRLVMPPQPQRETPEELTSPEELGTPTPATPATGKKSSLLCPSYINMNSTYRSL